MKALDSQGLEFLMFVLDELAEEMEAQGRDIIRLTLGKSQESLHGEIVNAYVAAVKDPSKRNVVYPQGLPELRRGIAGWYRESLGNFVAPEKVVVGAGTSPLLKDLFRLLLDPGDEVLIPNPYYSVYYYSAIFASARVEFYGVNPGTPCIDIADLAAKFRPGVTKIVLLNSPGNPYGKYSRQR
jgi:aspartate/methionine/tyrosine aminotransferase